VAVDAHRAPAGRLEALNLVDGIGQRQGTVDGDAVVVEEHDETAKLQMPGEGNGLLADTLHEVAIRGEHVGVVIDEIVAELGVEHTLGERHPDGGGETLAERPGRSLDARRHEIFRMARRLRLELAEALQLVEAHALDTREVQERIEQHRAVARRENEAVAVRPAGIARVVFEEFREQDRGDVGRAHGQAGMARFRLLDRIHGEGTHCVRQIGMGDAIGRGGFGHGIIQGRRARRRAPDAGLLSRRRTPSQTPSPLWAGACRACAAIAAFSRPA
jgi:hypothetical protein